MTPAHGTLREETSSKRRRAKARTPGPLGGSNRMLSIRDLAELLGISERTVRDQWRTWGLTGYRIGRHLRFREREIHAWIDSQTA
jgi:excisionase family DNA binding protein